MFFQQLHKHADSRLNDAVVTDEYTLSYKALLQVIVRCMHNLQNAGVGPNDVVGLTLENETEHLVTGLALMALGAGQVTLASHESPRLQGLLFARLGVSRVISSQNIAQFLGTQWLHRPEESTSEIEIHLGTRSATAPVLYLKTSGTTGGINIVPFSEEQIAAQAAQLPDYSSERLLRLASIEYNNSKRHRLYCVWLGGTNVFRPNESMDIVDFSLRHGVTCLDISRMHASDIATLNGAHRLKDVKIRTGGSAVPYSVRKALEEMVTHRLYVRYAATECGAIAIACPGEHDHDETVGAPLSGVELQIVDEDDNELKPGLVGEIRLRAPGMADSYVDSPQDSARRFRNQWFYPGDMGCLSAQGRLIIKGRADDMIILNGVNIFPAEIESILESHPKVRFAAALGLLSEVHGQIPVAAVELQPDADISGFQLQQFAKEYLNLKSPRRILIVDKLPRNSQGKIVRRELAQQFRPDRLGT